MRGFNCDCVPMFAHECNECVCILSTLNQIPVLVRAHVCKFVRVFACVRVYMAVGWASDCQGGNTTIDCRSIDLRYVPKLSSLFVKPFLHAGTHKRVELAAPPLSTPPSLQHHAPQLPEADAACTSWRVPCPCLLCMP